MPRGRREEIVSTWDHTLRPLWVDLGTLVTQGIGQGNVRVVLDSFVDIYACRQHGTSQLRGRGGIRLASP